ncbi:MAG: HAMP domain-containing protein [Chloroflexi bacterium]|uniref:HAMP domain-containing sensor histidine kinase n=1 Tax=Candidatus Flexifilum breve TaxID=3140694 RepID=UPI00313747D7|nr:HAMP domain-containing protein [Chloroflexota bacterium]
MDEIISLRTFGRKNNWFFDGKLTVGSLRAVLVAVGAVAALTLVLLTAYTLRVLQPLDAEFTRLADLDTAISTLAAQRWPVEQYLVTGEDYAAAEQGALILQTTIMQLAALTDDYGALNRLEDAGAAYLNLLRSYHNLTAAGEAESTLALLRADLAATAHTLEAVAHSLRVTNLNAAHTSAIPVNNQIALLALGLLLALGTVFAVTLRLVSTITRHSTRSLRDLREITCQITDGHLDARLNLTDEVDPDLLQLGQAFNRMADNLKQAQQAELAANEQNRLQLLKLARQERTTAILEERQRIARELHDSVKQQLFSITLSAGAILNLLTDAPPLVKSHLEHIKQAGHAAQSEMTSLVQELVSMPLQDKRLEDALLDYLNPLCATHGLKLLWRTDGTNTLTIAQEHALFRAVQEAVSNVVRHSSATVLRVSLSYGLLTHVIVEDNGRGFAPDKIAPTSNGLALMRARLKRVGGRVEVETTPETGTRLTIQLDLRRR